MSEVRGRRRWAGMLGELLVVVVLALVISALLRAFVGQMFVIPTGSMENTLAVGDRVAASRVSEVHRGDIVVFEDRAGWLAPQADRRGALRRGAEAIGLPPPAAPGTW
ncbi:S26 family signal peptidase [Luteococcus peritonei]|uniref:S26 family signal peptidase n=1 Tax=Luteococcus peritonei TaxID=88874 RepID=A0ABW4RZY3_9ACTN